MINAKKTALVLVTILSALPAIAEEAAAVAAHPAAGGGHHMNFTFLGLAALGAGLAIGLAAFGAASGQGKAAASALEGIARNPSASGNMFLPLILSLVFMEALGILAFLIAFFLKDQIGQVIATAFGAH
ncbi:MAG: ATP synthase F0 subunit C [Bdellovibrionaceae bacterium]|nr:ATP synthase F0 subunit C [Pseudobdellovibrionaceae bacterium]